MVSQSSASNDVNDRPIVVSSSALTSPDSDLQQQSLPIDAQNTSLESDMAKISLNSNDNFINQSISTQSVISPDLTAPPVSDSFTESSNNASSFEYPHDSSTTSSGADLASHSHMMSPSMIAAQQFIPYQQPQHSRQHFANTFTVSVTNIPLTYQWKDLRELVQSRVPNLHVIYTKLTIPGSGLLTIKGYQGAINTVQQLNGLVLNSGLMISAVLLNTLPPPFIPTYATAADETTSPPTLYSPMISPAAPAPGAASQESPGLFNGISYPLMYDPSAYVTAAQWGNPGLYGAATLPHNYVPQPRRAPYNKSGAYPVIMDKQRLFIGNIPFSTQWQDLKDYLRTGGNIFRVEIPIYENGQSKGYAIATFHTEQDAANAIKIFDRSIFNGRELNVRYDKHKRFGHGSNAPDISNVSDGQITNDQTGDRQNEPPFGPTESNKTIQKDSDSDGKIVEDGETKSQETK